MEEKCWKAKARKRSRHVWMEIQINHGFAWEALDLWCSCLLFHSSPHQEAIHIYIFHFLFNWFLKLKLIWCRLWMAMCGWIEFWVFLHLHKRNSCLFYVRDLNFSHIQACKFWSAYLMVHNKTKYMKKRKLERFFYHHLFTLSPFILSALSQTRNIVLST